MTDSIDLYRRYLQCQLQRLKSVPAKKQENQVKQFITISRETGAGGVSIGRMLAAYLSGRDSSEDCPWTVFDKSLVAQILADHELPVSTAQYMTEDKVSEIRDIIETTLELHPPSFALVRQTAETVLHLAHMGHAIMVGRGSNVITQKIEGGLHIRLIASLEKRREHVQDFYSLDEAEVEKKIKSEDKGRSDYLKQHYGKDIKDPLLYDLVINTGNFSYDDVAQIIGDEVLRRQKKIG